MPHSILIVEDDLTFATMLKTWLGKKGFSVDTASSNARARKQLDAQPYDLVLSDLRLPDQDGIFLLSWMKEQKYNIPLIIMTGYADIQSAVQAIKHGASALFARSCFSYSLYTFAIFCFPKSPAAFSSYSSGVISSSFAEEIAAKRFRSL